MWDEIDKRGGQVARLRERMTRTRTRCKALCCNGRKLRALRTTRSLTVIWCYVKAPCIIIKKIAYRFLEYIKLINPFPTLTPGEGAPCGKAYDLNVSTVQYRRPAPADTAMEAEPA